MTTREAIIQAMRQYAIAATGLASDKVIPARDSGAGPRPSLPYIIVDVLQAQSRRGTPTTTSMLDPLTGIPSSRMVTHHEVSANLQAYGVGAGDLIALCTHRLWDDRVTDQITTDGVRPTAPVGPQQDLSRVIGTDWEERASQDYAVTFQQTEQAAQEYGFAEQVQVESTLTDPAGDTVTDYEVHL